MNGKCRASCLWSAESLRHWIALVSMALAALFFSQPAEAHKASDSYLQIDAGTQGTRVRWDIALRDLDAAVDIDTDEDGKLTWGEVKAAWPQIEAYALPRLGIEGCVLYPTGRALERRNDGAYAVIMLTSDCVLKASPAIRYSLFREVDPTHRGIAKVQLPGKAPALMLLDPTRTGSTAADGSSAEADHAAPTGTWGFLREGVRHILTGYDHVLFLLCLLLPSVTRRTEKGWRPVDKLSEAIWPVIGIASAFTVAHSITLGLAASKLVSLPPALIEPAIAVTIILAAIDNVWSIFPVPRVVVTFFFGLIHGFGFAGVLSELNLPTSEFVLALLQFNVGLEIGQLIIVFVATTLLFLLRDWKNYQFWVIRVGSASAMLIAGIWLIERTANVSLMPF